MDYQTFRPLTTSDKQISKRCQIEISSQIITFFLQKFKTRKPPNTNSQNQSQSQTQNVPQQASQSVFFNDQPRATLDCSENCPFSIK